MNGNVGTTRRKIPASGKTLTELPLPHKFMKKKKKGLDHFSFSDHFGYNITLAITHRATFLKINLSKLLWAPH